MNRARRRVDSRHLSIESLESRRLLTTAMPDSFTFFEDSPTVLLDVMANDVIFGNLASIVRVSTVDYGIVEIQDSDKVAFTPARNAFGETSFTYTIRDQFGFESTGTASISILGVNDAPTINQVADIHTTYNEISREVMLRGVTAGPGESDQAFTINVVPNGSGGVTDFVVLPTDQPSVFRLSFQTAGFVEDSVSVHVQVQDSDGLHSLMVFRVNVIGLKGDTPLQNEGNILDVDGDASVNPLDLLNVVNVINFSGRASIPASSFPDTSRKYDVNGDNFVNPLDASLIMDALSYSAGTENGAVLAPVAPKGQPIFEFRYRILDSSGYDADANPFDDHVEAYIEEGSFFRVQLLARDLRPVPAGLFSSYSDLVFTNVGGMKDPIIEPALIEENGSIVNSVIPTLGGLIQGVMVDNSENVTGQRIVKGVGEYSTAYTGDVFDNEYHVVMSILFRTMGQGSVTLEQKLSDFLAGVPGIAAFMGTGDFLGAAEVILPTARVTITDGFQIFDAVDDSSSGLEDEVQTIAILSNDFDQTTTAEVVLPIAPPSVGGQINWVNGKVEYLPPPNFFGITSFTYTLRIADGREDTATVEVLVYETNDRPIISDIGALWLVEAERYVSDSFSVNAGEEEFQALRVTARSTNLSHLSDPIVQALGDGLYSLVLDPVPGFSGTTFIYVTAEDAGPDGLLETVSDNAMTEVMVQVYVGPNDRDYGDAPNSDQSGMLSSYPTRRDQDGAFHIGMNLRLGDLRDVELDGFPGPTANGDDLNSVDDEDGILFPFTHPISDRTETTSSYVANVSEAGFLDVWIDFNRDGDWNDPGENISRKVAVQAGRNLIPFQIPTLPLTGTVDTTFGRFRLSRTGDLEATGFGGEGEVEDHIMVMNRSFSQELEVYDHILGPHKVKVVDGFLVVTVGDMIVFRAPAENTSVFRRKNMSGETTFEMRNPSSNLPGQLSYEPVSDRIELTLARSDFNLGANTEFLLGLNTIRLGHSSLPSVLSLEFEAVRNLNSESALRIEMSREDSLRTESPWRPVSGRMQDGRWVQVFTVTSSPNSTEPLATLEVVSEAVWRNETRVTDADGDATTSPLDVLTLVNFINAKTFGEEGLLPPRTDSSPVKFPDVDGDQFLSALDVLNVINFLNTRGNGAGGNGEGEGESVLNSRTMKASFTVSPEAVDRYMFGYTDDFDQENRNNRRRRSL